ncbi:predicted protein [Botrytis cinerea T4]|uniref:Uncharacterized protein n=1 Tax=Botryotinia fuckeliana (strain T4) TaxID=999810 RepID=G2YZE9_BOTF4|nr:predicted protein [Botrytis cinerea T4]
MSSPFVAKHLDNLEDQMDPEIVISCRGSGKEVVSAVGGANKLVQARNNGNAIIPHES